MNTTLLFFVAWLTTCTPDEEAALSNAAVLAAEFDLNGALERLRTAGAGDCDAIGGGIEYLEALLTAPGAARQGGTDDSLRDIRSGVNALSRRAEGRTGVWEIASIALRAVAAASQSEVAEMNLLLDEATRLEALQLAAAQPGAPFVTAHELAGDLWMQLHRYDDARRAYQRAAERVGRTSRVRHGLARAAARLKDTAAACTEYQGLLTWWGSRAGSPPEVIEARTQVQLMACAPR